MLIREIAEAQQDVVRDLGSVDGIQAAATFGGLMLLPELQANHLRLEVLAHLSVLYGIGRGTPGRSLLQRSFERVGEEWAGVMEDPSEDVFTALAHTGNGNFRVREGIYEGAAFHLQRVLNIMAEMPREGAFARIHSSVEALLKLSDAVVARAGLTEYHLGDEFPKARLTPQILARLPEIRKMVCFTRDDLRQLEVTCDDLADFAFYLTSSSELGSDHMFHTGLQRRPLVFRGENLWFLLPSATGAAITRYIAEFAAATDQYDVLESSVVAEYARFFRESPLLGQGSEAPIYFQRMDAGGIAALMKEVDRGRFFHLIFFVERFEDFVTTGYSGTHRLSDGACHAIQFHLNNAAQKALTSPHFKEGMSIVVLCGLGRRIALPIPQAPDENWTIEVIPAFDFHTLCWIPGFDALSLIRLAAARSRIESEGVALLNASGLLNLVAWIRQLEGHLVPHASIPEAFASDDGPRVIAIEQNAYRFLRHDVLTTFDSRRVLDVDGRWMQVRREARSLFREERDAPLYFSEDAVREGRLRAVYVSKVRPYWIESICPEGADSHSVFQHFEMAYTWIRRAAPVIDRAMTGLSEGPVEFRVSFAEIAGERWNQNPARSETDLRHLIHTAGANSIVDIHIDPGFDQGLRQPENVAERALIEAIIAGVAQLAHPDTSQEQQAAIVNAICPGPDARSLHFFDARAYRDFIPRRGLGAPVLADDIDSAMFRSGLGWKVQSRDLGGDVAGADACKAFLNAVVMIVLDELCASLKAFDRKQLVELLLHNHEAVECERARWRRTARANIAMHDDRESAVATIVTRESRFTATSMACRILMEAAICECPDAGGAPPGHIDLTRLMAQALIAYHWGGYSDVIHWGAAEARLRITPLGDVHFDPQFLETVYEPFGRTGSERQVIHAAESYPELFSPPAPAPALAEELDSQFVAAWQAEFNTSIDELRRFYDLIEDHCQEKGNNAAVVMPCREVVRLMMEATGKEAGESADVLKQFVLQPRPSWRIPGPGYSNKDWFPWRFRRRYATVRAPLLQLDAREDPEIAFAPGLARRAFALTVGAYYEAEIPQSQVKSGAMRTWLGTRNHRHRVAFNKQVSERMAELGWKVRKEMTLPALIGGGLDRNYGDVDVVAWHTETGRVLLMECKDVQFHKAMGEVAEQLHDFRGELLADSKPDLLKKHLDRVAIIKSRSSAVARALKVGGPLTIEGHIVFKNPVPMRFVADRLAAKIRVSLFDELDQL